ncbi:MAG: nucleotidyl transferase family protein, partial [Rhodospirillaceae bacterium]
MTARSGRKPSVLLPPFGDRRQRRVGLLGGSFNPAHEGHIHLTREALRVLGLAQVWWLVSPQNPLKPVSGMAAFETRLEGAATAIAQAGLGRRAIATGLEARLGVTRTAQTLRRLRARY